MNIHNLARSLKQAEGLRKDPELLNMVRAEEPLAVELIEKSPGIAFYLLAAEGICVCKGMLGDHQPVTRLYATAQASKSQEGMERIGDVSRADLQTWFDAFQWSKPTKVLGPQARQETRDACVRWLQHIGDDDALDVVCPGQPQAIPICRALPAMLQLAEETGTHNVPKAVKLTRKNSTRFFKLTRK